MSRHSFRRRHVSFGTLQQPAGGCVRRQGLLQAQHRGVRGACRRCSCLQAIRALYASSLGGELFQHARQEVWQEGRVVVVDIGGSGCCCWSGGVRLVSAVSVGSRVTQHGLFVVGCDDEVLQLSRGCCRCCSLWLVSVGQAGNWGLPGPAVPRPQEVRSRYQVAGPAIVRPADT